jgi:uncharacterized protein
LIEQAAQPPVPIVKFLVVVFVVVLVAWLLMRPRKPGPAATPPAPGKPATPAQPAPQAMVQCSHCGLHLPRAEALLDERGAFCTEAHRLAGPGAR